MIYIYYKNKTTDIPHTTNGLSKAKSILILLVADHRPKAICLQIPIIFWVHSWNNYFFQRLNVYGVSNVRHMEIHTFEPTPFELRLVLKTWKGTNRKELIQAGDETLRYESHTSLILFGRRKNCMSRGRSLLLYRFTRSVIKLTAVIVETYHCYQLHIECYPIYFSQG
jgi:hypothetical protein